ncbi:MliC family protein [Brevirhabdus sp.]|uniref:MliC family protein n=1 Tax=Brevirhabdus sp. TaxID=2004514 RepID=UPI0040587EF6
MRPCPVLCTVTAALLLSPALSAAGELMDLKQAPVYRYDCQGTPVRARFHGDWVALRVSDGAPLTLARRRAASGARYANVDGTLVFWDRGGRASLQRGTERSECTRLD